MTEPATLAEQVRPPVALYVHFPFCFSICPYCDFVVVAGASARGPGNGIERLLEALLREIELRAPGRRLPLASVYLGGGTPSLMSAAQVAQLLERIESYFGIAANAELTIEANPGPDERGDLAGFRAAGINRLSIGAQSMDAGELHRLGRRHQPLDVAETARAARRAGFDNVSLDLLYDLPGQTIGAWRTTLNAALALEPDHVSVYALTLDDPDAEGLTVPAGDHLPLRPGARRWRERAIAEQDDERAADMYLLASDVLAAAGMAWYEISNWARRGRGCRHNLAYWTGRAWEAVGPGAHAYDGLRTRRWNAARLDTYVAALADDQLPPGGQVTVDRATASAEAAILHLRTAEGLPAPADDTGHLQPALAWGVTSGLLERGDGTLHLTIKGRLLASELFSRMLPEPSSAPA